MELVERKVILGSHPGILVAHSSRIPRLLAQGDDVPEYMLPEGIYANGIPHSCGVSILVVSNGGSPPRRATIGGFVSIQNEYYALTTAHAFLDTKPADLETDCDLEFGFSTLGEPESSSDEEDFPELTSKGKQKFRSSRTSFQIETKLGTASVSSGSSRTRDSSLSVEIDPPEGSTTFDPQLTRIVESYQAEHKSPLNPPG